MNLLDKANAVSLYDNIAPLKWVTRESLTQLEIIAILTKNLHKLGLAIAAENIDLHQAIPMRCPVAIAVKWGG